MDWSNRESIALQGMVVDGQPRYRAHSDYTGFTILLQDEADHGGPADESPAAGGAGTATSTDGGGRLEIDLHRRTRVRAVIRATASRHHVKAFVVDAKVPQVDAQIIR